MESVKKLLSPLRPSQTRLFRRVQALNGRKTGMVCEHPTREKHTGGYDATPLSAKLSMRYTNHCIRATVVTDLKDAGFSNHEGVPSQKRNERSIIGQTRQGRV